MKNIIGKTFSWKKTVNVASAFSNRECPEEISQVDKKIGLLVDLSKIASVLRFECLL